VPQQILDGYSGVHAMEGIFAIAGHGVPAGVDLGERSIVDVAPTLLALLGRPVPSDSDGAVMTEALRDGVAVREGADSYQNHAAGDEAALSAEEEATLERSLRALGYLE
jgi:arylsulfatase A-like enzyme